MNKNLKLFAKDWRNVGLRIEGIYLLTRSQNWKKEYCKREWWIYLVVLEGKVKIQQGTWEKILNPGEQVVLGQRFNIMVVSDTATWLIVDFLILISMSITGDPVKRLNLPVSVPVKNLKELQRNVSLINRIAELNKTKGRLNYEAVFSIRWRIDLLLSEYFKEGLSSGILIYSSANMPDWLIIVSDYIREHFREDLRIDNIAKHAGVSRVYLYKMFLKYFGMPPSEYLWKTRLILAARLIDRGDLYIGNIAYRCGFKTHSHFTARFKKEFGITPQEWRRKDI